MRTEKEQAMWTKAEKLTAKLTLDEKIKMVHGAELFQTKGGERLGIPPLKMSQSGTKAVILRLLRRILPVGKKA